MDGLPAAWVLARNALDHHDMVTTLAASLATILDDETGELGQRIAARQATELGRAGLALVRIDGAELTTDMISQVDAHLREEAATDWFSRKDDL